MLDVAILNCMPEKSSVEAQSQLNKSPESGDGGSHFDSIRRQVSVKYGLVSQRSGSDYDRPGDRRDRQVHEHPQSVRVAGVLEKKPRFAADHGLLRGLLG